MFDLTPSSFASSTAFVNARFCLITMALETGIVFRNVGMLDLSPSTA